MLKLPPTKLEPWIVLCNFFLLMLLFISINTIRPCMEYCCLVWAGAPSYDFELLYKLQKRIYRAVGSSLATSFEPSVLHRNAGCLSLFYRYYFGRSYLNWLNWFHFHILEVGLLLIMIDSMIFWSPFQDVINMYMSTVSRIIRHP